MQQGHQNSSSCPQQQLSPRLDKKTKAHINTLLRNAVDRQWCRKHGKSLPPPKLPRVVLRVIKEWFLLVDDDGSGTLEHHELLAALQAAHIPCDAASITEMIKLMDANHDGCISWAEFEAFMKNEFAAGQQLLSGEFVLPSGTALPFGSMIRQLKRNQMLKDVTEGGEARTKWLHFDINLAADAAELHQAEEAIRIQKEYNETLHLHIQQQHQQQMVAAATVAQWQQQVVPPAGTAAPGGLHALTAGPAAGVIRAAATAGGVESTSAAGGCSAGGSSPKARPVGVPRLQLGSVSGSGVTQQQGTISSSSRTPAGFLTDTQRAALLGRLPANMDTLVGSPRLPGSSSPSTQPSCSARLHGLQQPPTARSARGAAAKYAGLCSSARAAAAAATTSVPAQDAAAAGPGGQAAQLPAAAAAAGLRLGAAGQQLPNSARSSSARRPCSASSGHHVVLPQPSRDEWRAVAASCFTQRHAAKCRSPQAVKPGSAAAAHPAGQQGQPDAGAGAGQHLSPVFVQPSQAGAAAAAAAPCAQTPGFAVRQWEQATASSASTARRTYRAGAAAQASAAAAAAGLAASTHRGANPAATICSSAQQHGPAARSLQPGHTAQQEGHPCCTAPAAGADAVSRAQPAASEPSAPSNNDRQLGTPRTGRQAKAAFGAAGGSGVVNSPRVARQAAAAAAAAAAGDVSHRAAHSPRRMPDWQLVNTAMSSGTQSTPRDNLRRQQQQQQQCKTPGRSDRQSSGSSCADCASQFDTNRAGVGRGTGTPRQQQAAVNSSPKAGRQLGSVLDASCKYLLSACAVPPAALLSPRYVGPVEAAVMKAHTPRHRQ